MHYLLDNVRLLHVQLLDLSVCVDQELLTEELHNGVLSVLLS